MFQGSSSVDDFKVTEKDILLFISSTLRKKGIHRTGVLLYLKLFLPSEEKFFLLNG